jgi:hypothetical protein
MHLYNGMLVRAGYEKRLERSKRKDELESFLTELGYSNSKSSEILDNEELFTVVDLLNKYHHFTLEKSAGEDSKKLCKSMNKSTNPNND